MVVLDASALIAMMYEEKGGDAVISCLPNARISTVNVTEVASYMIERGVPMQETQSRIEDLSLNVRPYTIDHAFLAAELRKTTRSKGLSLGDRACLALAISEKLPVITSDKAWKTLDIGVDIRLIR